MYVMNVVKVQTNVLLVKIIIDLSINNLYVNVIKDGLKIAIFQHQVVSNVILNAFHVKIILVIVLNVKARIEVFKPPHVYVKKGTIMIMKKQIVKVI